MDFLLRFDGDTDSERFLISMITTLGDEGRLGVPLLCFEIVFSVVADFFVSDFFVLFSLLFVEGEPFLVGVSLNKEPNDTADDESRSMSVES